MNEQEREKIKNIIKGVSAVSCESGIVDDEVIDSSVESIAAIMPKPLDVEELKRVAKKFFMDYFSAKESTAERVASDRMYTALLDTIASRFCAAQYDRNAIVCELLQSKLDNAFVDYQNTRITKRKLIEHIADAVEAAPVERVCVAKVDLMVPGGKQYRCNCGWSFVVPVDVPVENYLNAAGCHCRKCGGKIKIEGEG